MGSVFISYRRDDSRDASQALAAALMARLGKRNVFLDVDSIAGGELFPQRLEQALGASSVVVVVIGPRWLTATNDRGERRLDNPADFVRREIEHALASGITLLPLLVHGAALPAAADLPPSLRPLAVLSPLTPRDTPGGAPDLVPAARTIRRAALEGELRRLPRVASPVLLTLAAAASVAAIPYIANKALGLHWFGTNENAINTWAGALTGWTFVVAIVMMIRARRWAWLAVVIAFFVAIALLNNNPASYLLEAPLALCIGLFALTGRRFSLLFAARRLRRQGA